MGCVGERGAAVQSSNTTKIRERQRLPLRKYLGLCWSSEGKQELPDEHLVYRTGKHFARCFAGFFFLIFHAQMTWPTLSFPLHTVPIQNTTNLQFSHIFLKLGAFSLSETGLILLRQSIAGTFPKQRCVLVSRVSETILPISHPIFALFFFPVAHTHASLKKAKLRKVPEVLHTQPLHRNRPSTQKTHFQTKRSNNSTDDV